MILRDYGHKDGGDRRSEAFQFIHKKLDKLKLSDVLNSLETNLPSYDRSRRILASGVPSLGTLWCRARLACGGGVLPSKLSYADGLHAH